MPYCYKCRTWVSSYDERYVEVEGQGYHEACAPPNVFLVWRCLHCFTLITNEDQLAVIDKKPYHRDCAIAKGLQIPVTSAIVIRSQSQNGPDRGAATGRSATEPTAAVRHVAPPPASASSAHKGHRGWRKRHPEWVTYRRQAR